MNLAPNGKPSNLTPEQYRLVRTPAFKAWFGDWENSPETASKVVDENGEPLVVWHNSNSEKVNVFESKFGYNFFATDVDTTYRYGGKRLYSCFINARKIFDVNKLSVTERNDIKLILKDKSIMDTFIRFLEENGYREWDEDLSVIEAYKEYHLKNNLKFENLDISDYELLVKVFFEGDNWFLIESSAIQNYIKKNKYNAFKTVEYHLDIFSHQRMEYNIAVYDSNNIKLADGTNTTFDSNNPDIRYKNGGTLYHGGYDIGDDLILRSGYYGGRKTGVDSGAIFFTPSLKYAKQYVKDKNGLYKYELNSADKIFDGLNESHYLKLKKGFLKDWQDDYSSKEDAIIDYLNSVKSIKSSISYGAIDWATGSQFIDQINKAGFDGIKFLERPAENIELNKDGGYDLTGEPVYSYALFKDEVKVDRYKKGGEFKDVVCSSCGWGWNKHESEEDDVYVCHKCGTDNNPAHEVSLKEEDFGFFKIYLGEKEVGYISYDFNKGLLEIISFFIKSEYRNKGIGAIARKKIVELLKPKEIRGSAVSKQSFKSVIKAFGKPYYMGSVFKQYDDIDDAMNYLPDYAKVDEIEEEIRAGESDGIYYTIKLADGGSISDLLSSENTYKYYHGTTLKNYKKLRNVNSIYFTPLYDDAVMYALIGNEANFENKLKKSNDDVIDLIHEKPKEALIKLFDKDDKPIILIYETNQDIDEYEIIFPDIKKSDLKIKIIDFNEYDNVEPMWVILENYIPSSSFYKEPTNEDWEREEKGRFSNGGLVLLSSQEVEDKLGRKLDWWNDDIVYLSGIKYKKVYLRPEYKKVK